MKYDLCTKCKYFDKTITPCDRCFNTDMFENIIDTKLSKKLFDGIKNDDGKLDWTLIPWEELEEVVKVLEFGAKKYSRDNWKNVSSDRYKKAAMRHLISYIRGEEFDPESNNSHLAHLACNALFLMWKDNNQI